MLKLNTNCLCLLNKNKLGLGDWKLSNTRTGLESQECFLQRPLDGGTRTYRPFKHWNLH
jgi:hypothetical protein